MPLLRPRRWLNTVREPPWSFRILLRVPLLSLFGIGPATTLCSWLNRGSGER